jgi:hypothetical protein
MTNVFDIFFKKFAYKFPKLKQVLVDLLTTQYEIFMKEIQWVAPCPTTFRIVLGNDESFLLIYTERSWIAQIEGKKYYLLNLSEEEGAAEAISRLLAYGLPVTKDEDVEADVETDAEAEETEEIPAEA